MMAAPTRRAALLALVAISAGGCVQGKLVHTIAFELSYDARSRLSQAVQSFALAERFKVTAAWEPTSAYWPHWTLTSDDIDIDISPQNEEPALADAPPPRGPVAYAAQFYDHSALGAGARLREVISSFTRSLGAVDGVQKLRDERSE